MVEVLPREFRLGLFYRLARPVTPVPHELRWRRHAGACSQRRSLFAAVPQSHPHPLIGGWGRGDCGAYIWDQSPSWAPGTALRANAMRAVPGPSFPPAGDGRPIDRVAAGGIAILRGRVRWLTAPRDALASRSPRRSVFVAVDGRTQVGENCVTAPTSSIR